MIPRKYCPPFGHLEILQVTLNHCKEANVTLEEYLIREIIDIPLLQDAYCNREGTLTDILISWAVFPFASKCAHVVIQNTNLIYSHLYTETHCTFATIFAKGGKLIIG